MTKPHLEILNPKQKEVFLQLKSFAKEGTLGGGTAIALQIRHRYSYDFDIFLKKEITKSLWGKAKKVFKVQERIVDTRDQLTFLTKRAVKVTFLFYPFPAIHEKLKTATLPLFHLKDLASDKAATIGRRGMWRDYVDLFFLLKKGVVSLRTVIKESEKRFGADFSTKLFLEQLTYYGDIHDFHVDFISVNYPKEEIQKFYKDVVVRFKKTQLR